MPLEEKRDGVTVRVHVQARSAKSGVTGLHGNSVKIKLISPPVDNRANEELVKLLSGLMKIPKGDVKIVRGKKDRRKRVFLTGVTLEVAREKLGLD